MDIQGSETQALKGSKKLLKKNTTWFIEVHTNDDYQERVETLKKSFKDHHVELSLNYRSKKGYFKPINIKEIEDINPEKYHSYYLKATKK
ncbi:FkbM family methyltransferase [Candidatus Woesearchaeota archaeon]|nr:FkbM family methyltransferase [Candidatus Woesearchaeota archaeon]